MRISERQQERKKGRLARYGRLENYIIPRQREVLDIGYYVDNGYEFNKGE